ncbi:hypothetical protein VKT23_006145 [Stygiomarasmius scandens]|uniref:Uncharacterized protein n=1 Tax=Marasmiellus scandens TaxID=2682957 RepID=A0ABR1JQ54_9AGAR
MDAEIEGDAFCFLRGLNWSDISRVALSSVCDPYTGLAIFEGMYDSLVSHCRYYRTHPEKLEPAMALAFRAMLQQKYPVFVCPSVRQQKHQEWHLNAEEEEHYKDAGLVWTPGTTLPPVNREPQITRASLSMQGRKRAHSVGEPTEDEEEEYRDVHKKHKKNGGTSHKGAEESSSLAPRKDASDVSLRPPFAPPEINSIPSATFISYALRPVSFDPLSSKKPRRKYTHSEKISMGIALATHACLQEPPATGYPSVLKQTGFIQLGKDLVGDVEYDESHKLVCTQCVVRGLKCTETVKILGKDTQQCHNCYKARAGRPCSHREPGSALFQQLQSEYLAGYSKGNFRELKWLSLIQRHSLMVCMGALRSCEMSWAAVEGIMKMSSSSCIAEAMSRSPDEVDFLIESLPVIGYILSAPVRSARNVSGMGGDPTPQKPQTRARISKTPFIDAAKLFVQELVGSAPCSACALESFHLHGTVVNLRAIACTHEEPYSRFDQIQKEYMKRYSPERATELQQWLQLLPSQLRAYSRSVVCYRRTRAALDESMLIFADRVTAVALRSTEELDFVMERVPFVGWIVDTAGRMRGGHKIEVPSIDQMETEWARIKTRNS